MAEQEENIIETDADTQEEYGNDGGLYPYDPTYTDIEISTISFSIFEYLRRLDKGDINIEPDFQRNRVWSQEQKSKFIESIILNFPLPPIYLNETKGAKYTVIDGLQRTSTLLEFYNDDLVLKGIEALPKYNDYRFTDLSDALQSKFENKSLTIFSLKPSTPIKVIYDLFNRINTGGTQLNRQEVRNCIFIGHSTRLLNELSEETVFKQAIDNGVSGKRMKDREVILRYIAFRWFDFLDLYNGNMSYFLEEAMRKINGFEEEALEKIKNDFKQVMEQSYIIWGTRNFRIPTDKTRGTINTAIFETVCSFISHQNDAFLERNRDIIIGNYSAMITDENYLDAVTTSTNSKSKVLARFELAHRHLNRNTI